MAEIISAWLLVLIGEFLLKYEDINNAKKTGKFFYTGLPGSDVLRTMGAAVMPLSESINESIGGISSVADAAVLGARGNAGVILSQLFVVWPRGWLVNIRLLLRNSARLSWYSLCPTCRA